VALCLLLTGCISTTPGPDGNYTRPIGGAPVTENPTPYSAALECLGDYARQAHLVPPHIAVGRISDYTGQLDSNGGRPVTQGAMLMAISALGKAGVPLVERYETDVPKLEFDLANNKLVSDQPLTPDSPRRDYRAIYPGEVSGSDYFLTGGITELNTSIRSNSATLGLTDAVNHPEAPHSGDASSYVMNIGLDLRLVNTSSLDIVDIVSYQKQIIGYQVGAGLFAFFGNQVLSVSGQSGAEEPMHLATRSLIERAVVEIVAKLYHLPPGSCFDSRYDPLRGDPKPGQPQAVVPPPNVARNDPPELRTETN
jgi:curli production assembly/transport component CsgG/holdfast attachment protein HfaB